MFIKDEVVFINLQNLKDEFYCAVCNFPLTSQQDFEKNENYKCCQRCFLDFAESRKKEWLSGWRPEKAILRQKINFRKQVMTKINNK